MSDEPVETTLMKGPSPARRSGGEDLVSRKAREVMGEMLERCWVKLAVSV
jgi:hypothetical protein